MDHGKKVKKDVLSYAAKQIATLGPIGYIPAAQGTVASLVAVGLYVLVKKYTFLYFSLTALLIALGFWSTHRALVFFSKRDPSQMVIDEFSAMMLTFIFVPLNIKFLVAGFALFRFFDIIKIPPVKRLERLRGGYGIMMDDIAAAIMSNLILQVLKSFPFMY